MELGRSQTLASRVGFICFTSLTSDWFRTGDVSWFSPVDGKMCLLASAMERCTIPWNQGSCGFSVTQGAVRYATCNCCSSLVPIWGWSQIGREHTCKGRALGVWWTSLNCWIRGPWDRPSVGLLLCDIMNTLLFKSASACWRSRLGEGSLSLKHTRCYSRMFPFMIDWASWAVSDEGFNDGKIAYFAFILILR